MALHHELPIYKDTYALLDLVIELVKNFPRDFKRFGERLRDECLEMVILIFRANVAKDKLPHLHDFRERLQLVVLILRMSSDKRWISIPQHAASMLLTESIGKQSTGWLHSCPPSPVG
jgi:expansin (peptidoglycan-binding protein)